jgi:hypothetical protein
MADTPSARSRLQSIARRVMVERGLQPEFSRGAMAQARAIPDPPPASDGLSDLTSLSWCSIDNDDSRDLDQLSVAERGSDGRTIVRVAIADVDALVPRGSPIDDHARANTTSVYTPAQIFPMLSERLSTDLTSLVPDEPRAALGVEMQVADDGSVPEASIVAARVLNRARLAYDATAPYEHESEVGVFWKKTDWTEEEFLFIHVIGHGLLLVLAGIGLGVAGGAALTRLFSSLLYGVTAVDPIAFASAAAALLAVGMAAALIPAWRAGTTDPAIALREE